MLQILSELALPTPSAAAGAAATGAPGSSATPPVVLVPYVNLSNPAHALRFARELGLVTPSGAAGVNAPTPATIAPLVASTVPERDPRQQDASAAGSGLEPRSSKRLRNQ
ncbi:hypothetical protein CAUPRSCDRAFT_12728 [Caulochytrium protostelioides]|uniref:Uncharacterized protein n=1 Tax=Caulochytrium protostelioides TaxID=1555241 RepID=A0A4P9WT35_9FUNG|nr:hypothetical protein CAUPRSCDRAFT_12728 [Caulochytrium protostelioides]